MLRELREGAGRKCLCAREKYIMTGVFNPGGAVGSHQTRKVTPFLALFRVGGRSQGCKAVMYQSPVNEARRNKAH